MKKIILIIVLFLATILVINAEEEVDNNVNQPQIICDSNIWDLKYLNVYVDNSFTNIATVKHINDNKYAFCIEPDILMKPCNDYKSSSYTSEKLDELAKIYKAYEYLGCPEDLYVGTQMLIWETLGYYKTIDGKGSEAYGSKEIKAAINNVYNKIKPKIKVDDSYPMHEAIYLVDENNLLNKYEIKSYSNGLKDVEILDNKLKFQINDIYPLTKSITLKPKDNINKKIKSGGKVYFATGSQSLFSYEGKIPDKYEEITITFTHHSGDLLLNKKDEWSTNIKEKIGFEIYKIDEDSEEIILTENESSIWYTNDKGQLLIEDTLYPGLYKIIEADTNYKYVKCNKSFEFEIVAETTKQYDFINMNRDINLSIDKIDKNNNYLISDTTYKLYDISDTLTTSINGLEIGLIENVINTYDLDLSKIYSVKKGHDINLDRITNINNGLYLFIDNASKAYKINDNILSNYYSFGDLYSLEQYSNIIIDNLKQEYQQNESLDMDYIIKILETNDFSHPVLINNLEMKSGLDYLYFIVNYEQNSYILEIPIYINVKSENLNVQIYKYELLGDLLIGDKNELINGYLINELNSKMGMTYIYNPLNHNYPLSNTEISLYDSSNEFVGNYTTDINGLIDLKDQSDGDYYYTYNEIKVFFNKQNNQFINNLKLKQDRKYLLCESTPSVGYTYIDSPCVYIDTHNQINDINEELTISNTLGEYEFELFKVNGNYKVNLDGAEFDVYLEEYKLDNQIQINNEIEIKERKYLGKYISGFLNLNINDYKAIYDENYIIHIFKNNELIKEINYKDNINLELDIGDYLIKVYDPMGNKYLEEFEKEVKNGVIKIDNIPYNYKIILKETKAPKSYYTDNQEIEILPNQNTTISYLPYYRINQLIIVPTKTT